MKYHLYLVFVLLCLTAGCKSDDISSNPLDENELLGLWEINAEGLNNVMSLEALCCDFIEFLDDNNSNDLRGNYKTYVHTNITDTGTFSINIESNVITYSTENDNTYLREYAISNNILELWYFDDDDNRHWVTYQKITN